MIGWRVGWVVGPADILADIRLVGLTNVVCQVGLAQQARRRRAGRPGRGRRRRRGMAPPRRDGRPPAGRIPRGTAARRMVPAGGHHATGDHAGGAVPAAAAARQGSGHAHERVGAQRDHYLRLVFANEPTGRLTDLGERFRATIG